MSETILIKISTPTSRIPIEKRYNPEFSLKQLKDRLYPLTGIEPKNMVLILKNEKGETIQKLENETLSLTDSGIKDNYEIEIQDSDPNGIYEQLQNEKVEKYVMSKEEYDKREDSFKKYRLENPQLFKSKKVKNQEKEKENEKDKEKENDKDKEIDEI
ncbi:tubulin folding cofactor b [Anaeramoeba ignava]|uniref:Tubulin folding cofactor b n=1 Tax=Anaeramoeba ignava TaxID=1746090 RepID=A0A9Q0L525_ANAIG|nr:tubulin folding cofactor b [Anaeramoeba ignava]